MNDCGAFAMAFAVSLVYRQKPELIEYDHSLMRHHLCAIFESKQIRHFPVIRNNNFHPNLLSLDEIRAKELRASQQRRLRENNAQRRFEEIIEAKRMKFDNSRINNKFSKIQGTTENLEEANVTIRDISPTTKGVECDNEIPQERYGEKAGTLPGNIKTAHYATNPHKIEAERSEDGVKNKKDKGTLINFSNMKKELGTRLLKPKKTNATVAAAEKIKCKYSKMKNQQNYPKLPFSREDYINRVSENLEGSTLENRLEAERIVKWSLYQRQNYTKTLYKKLEHLKKKSDHHLSHNIGNFGGLPAQFTDVCGPSRHTKSSESYFYETSYNFHNLNSIVIVMNKNGQALNILPSSWKHGKYTWKCTEMCRIFHDPSCLENYILLLEKLRVQKLRTIHVFLRIFMGKSHPSNKRGHLSYCYSGDSCCSALFSALQLLSPHFPAVRYIRDLIYQINALLKKLMTLDDALNASNIHLLKEIIADVKQAGIEPGIKSDNICLDEDKLQEQFKAGFLAFSKRSLDTPSRICISCQKLCYERDVKSLSDLKIPIEINPNWEVLMNHYINNYEDGIVCGKPIYRDDSICVYCLNGFRSKCAPSTCVLNNLDVGEMPVELQNLNDYEKILIQRAKAYQVVQRAGTVANKKLPHTSRIQKMKGQTFYLPLPLEETLKKICPANDPLNKDHELYILVRSLPTKANIVWENLVDMNKVFRALCKLREINPFYYDIQLPQSAVELFTLLSKNNVEYTIEPGNSKDHPVPDDAVEATNTEPDIIAEHKKPALLTQVVEDNAMYTNYTIQPMHDQRVNETSTKLYQMLKVKDVPLKHYLESLDLLCFPDLYPYGKNGLHAEREIRLTDAVYIKTRICSIDARFRLNIPYLFFLQNDANIRQLNSGIYHLLNITNPKERMNANQYMQKIENGELEGKLDTIFERVRNSEQFWRIPRNDLDCMVRHYGPATWFLTVSPAEWLWDDLILYLRNTNAPYCDQLLDGELIASDPVSVARFIDNKFHAILDFILSESHPIGEIEHYFWRREYQSRGIPHFHLIIWVKDAPILEVQSPEEIIHFISRYVTCKIPPESVSPQLHKRVTTHQKHRHNNYCSRTKKLHGKSTKVCRFGFSRPVTESFVLRSTAVSVAGRKKLKTKCRLYDLPRSKEEEDINDYNPAILTLWEGNMDIQFIGEKSGLLTVYCTKYASKFEVAGSDFELINDINRTKTIRQLLWNVAFRSLNHREIGAIEVADTLLGLSLYRTDTDTVIKWLNVQQVRSRRVKPKDYVQALDPESTDIFYPSLIDEHYPARPVNLESLSLYDFAKWYDIVKTPPVDQKVECYKMEGFGYLRRRRRGYLINHYRYNPNVQPENYYYSLLLLFKPWRDTDELKGNFETFTESFIHHKDELIKAYEYHDQLEAIQKAYDEIKEKIDREMGSDDNHSDDDELLLGCDPVEAEAAMKDFHDMDAKAQNDSVDLADLIDKMNDDQNRIFEKVKKALSSNDNEVLRLYVSGEGGTGKSFLIEVIRRWIRENTPYNVAITAPTGLAAFSINGLTIHKLLQLPVEHGSGILKYRQLSDKALKVIREELKDVELIIIDEISMVSNLMLLFINLRLVEIFNSVNEADNAWFGGKHILVFGDLLQLPPVRANPTFVALTQTEMQKHVGSMGTFDLWTNLFSYDELSIKMRQKTDTIYGDILSRLRIGMTTTEDIALLESRKIPLNVESTYDQRLDELCQYIQNSPLDTVCLLATCKQCGILNDRMLDQIAFDEISLKAMDEYSGTNLFRKKAYKLLENYEDDASETAGLLKEIKVKIGAKVMIRRNIDVTKGLVNGAIGTVRSVSKYLDNDNIEFITLALSNGGEYTLERVIAKIQIVESAFIIRRQFPICLCYGMTIHKSQGLSLDNAIVDVGTTVFAFGQTYVALSRLKSLNGLHLINFDPHSIKISKHAIGEYNRLRATYRPDLPLYEESFKTWRKTFDFVWAVRAFNIHDACLPNPVRETSNWSIRIFSECPKIFSYLHTTLQGLFNSVTVRQKLQENATVTSSELSILFAKYVDGSEVLNSFDIRNSLGDPFDTNQPQEPGRFIDAICQKDTSLKSLVEHQVKISSTCTTCAYTSSCDVLQSTFVVPPNNSKKSMSLPETFTTFFRRYNENGFCLNCGDIKQLSSRLELTSVSSIFILEFPWDKSIKLNNYLISAVPSSKISICNKTYQVVSATFHYNLSADVAQYMSFLRSNKSEWITINDDKIDKARWPKNSKDVHLLFLEKCENGNNRKENRRKH